MKFMKLGSRPDTFFSAETLRSVSSEISTDITVLVQNCRFLLHKFPLLSKCSHLKRLLSESPPPPSDHVAIDLPDFPGGPEAFEVCAKFCYGITITVSALNIVAVRCAAEYLQMTDDIDRGNLAGKLEAFLNSCVLRRWKDSLVALQSTSELPLWSEELGVTARCIDAVASIILAHPSKSSWYQSSEKPMSRSWWAEDISELGIDHFWRVMVSVKSGGGRVPGKLVGEAVRIYARRWLPNMSRDVGLVSVPSKHISPDSAGDIASKHRLLLEKIVSLVPMEKGSTSCSFILRLLKAANILNASAAAKTELARRAGLQLEEAAVGDLLIPSLSVAADGTLYDVDIVMTILEEFMLQAQSPPTSPPREKPGFERRRRSRSAENVEFEGQENGGRRSSSASHSSKLKVAKLIDGYLQEVARDVNLPMGKLVKLAEMIPEFARTDHDDLYRVIDIYLGAHPDLDKSERKQLCRILDCKKLSVEACMHAAQNEMLPLRVVVQVLFFEQARAAMSGNQVKDLPNSIKALLQSTVPGNGDIAGAKPANAMCLDDDWSISGIKCQKSNIATLRMKLDEDDNAMDDEDEDEDEILKRSGLMRSYSSRFKSLCAIPNKPRRILSKLWTLNRSASQRH